MFHHIDIVTIVRTVGYAGVLLIIFAETGLFIGFFLPGDSLIFTAGLLASQHVFNLWILIPATLVSAIAGYFLAYWFGEKLGHWLLQRKDSIWFKKKYIWEAEKFYSKHGGKALIIGRLVPIIRTFVPIVAGMARMKYRRYAIYNLIGALIWVCGLALLGYYLGQTVPAIGNYLLPIILLIIFISLLPAIWQFFKRHR
jgi:membrane-associated protein